MAYQHQRFHTDGSNALKPETPDFDVFVKPQFSQETDSACIIEFDDARKGIRKTVEGDLVMEVVQTPLAPTKPIERFTQKIKDDRILGDLFAPARKNTYRAEDIVVFAKGFMVTGFTAFFLILFGA